MLDYMANQQLLIILRALPQYLKFFLEVGQWFADLGVENSGGTKCFSVTGNVRKPANFEVPMGTPFSELLELAGGLKKGRKLKAVIPGGSSTPY